MENSFNELIGIKGYLMQEREAFEVQEIEREEAVNKIAALVKYYSLSKKEVLSVFSSSSDNDRTAPDLPQTKNFDPFFDAW
ncbi:hypothetical protein [Porphyrobacter sp. TH134]|uniref:hypothetical protein n=1 Tax=Porphyrobacter sp. TH134 TaxID=2067450 RepID=UPI00117D4FB5|nr:hypothetical protein [Porphyrobacter sp. TH134]